MTDDTLPEAEVEAAVRRLQADYWARVDYLDEAPAEALFTEDAVFELGTLTLRGRSELGAFFRRRKETTASAGRTTRHLSANLRLWPLPGGRVRAFSTVMVMTGYGALPIASSIPSVGDFEDECVKEPDGAWRFSGRRASSIFAGPDAPAFAKTPAASDEER